MESTVYFQKALPVWEVGKSREMNQMLLFEARVTAQRGTLLRIAGHTGYRVFVNGAFVHFGPARAARGFYRVEEITIEAEGDCTVSVLSTGDYCRSFYWVREPSFLCAELICNGEVLACTGDGSMRAYSYPAHIQKVQRYSYQRPFCEVYDYRAHPEDTRVEVAVECTEDKRLICRGITIPMFTYDAHRSIIASGSVQDRERKQYWKTRFSEPGEHVDGFFQKDLEVFSLRMVEKMELTPDAPRVLCLPLQLFADTYVTADMAGNHTGLIELEVEATEDADLFLTFDEILSNGKIDFLRLSCANVVMYRLKGGERYHLLTAEPYTLGYLNVIVRGGGVRLERLGMRRVGFDRREIVRSLNTQKADAAIARIYHAALESFCQNTFDIFMDCPSRERAGWLCDSFFTARVEHLLTGKSEVERNFLSNYAMAEHFDGLPDGMLPMCYPADVINKEFIPNWAMWLVLQLAEYFDRTGDRALVDSFKSKTYALLSYFRRFENERGLLERLDGWIFVEWSRCNDLVQDINYPTNMLYYRFKSILARLYGDETLAREARALRETVRRDSRMGLFFCDNAVRGEDGALTLSGICTETCQYYAFFMGVASREEDAELWETMVRDFGPERKIRNTHPEIPFSNAFIGNYLRLELLCQAKELARLEENIRGYFDFMAKKTDTLWENDTDGASCNHGFASHVLVWLDALGYLE